MLLASAVTRTLDFKIMLNGDLFIPITRTPDLFIPHFKSTVFQWSLHVTIFIESTLRDIYRVRLKNQF